MLATSARAQLLFETNGGTLTVVAIASDVSVLDIPAQTNGLPITGIGSQALCGGALRRLALPASITNIAPDAFACLCPTLTNIVVDEANPAYCAVGGVLLNKAQTALLQFPGGRTGSYSISNGITSIGDNAFYFASGMTNITLCEGITNIGNGAFAICAALSRIAVPRSVVNVGDSAFSSCVAITNVTLGANVLALGDAAFSGCIKLKEIFFQGNMPAVESRAFLNAPATVFYLPDTSGWGDSCGGAPTVLWNPKALTGDGRFGVQKGQFEFTIAGTAGIPFVVEACTNFNRPCWVALQTCNLTNGSIRFLDRNFGDFPARFYRMRSP